MPAPSRIRRILVPTDFSPASRAALPLALKLARSWRASIVLLHVIDLVPLAAFDGAMMPLDLGRAERERTARLEAERRRVGKACGRTLIANGSPADEIIRQAKRCRCDLIVMSTHGLRGLMRWILGSVAERVVRGAACPVMVVKP